MGQKRKIALCMELTDRKANAAILLNEVLYFLPYSRDTWGGMKCITQTNQDLMERTGMTAKQVKCAKRYLKEHHIIETKVVISKYHNGHTATKIRVPDEVQEALLIDYDS